MRPPLLAGLVLGLLSLSLLGAKVESVQADAQTERNTLSNRAEKIRGMTVSCRRWGPGEWDSPAYAKCLDELKGLGVNWVSIHPYARIGGDGSVRYRPGQQDASSANVPVPYAQDRGVKTFLKPHLAYWGSPFSWRGVIRFDENPEALERFFTEYEAWIVHMAKLAQETGAEAFCVGTELQGTVHHQARWRQIIAKVRAVYDGPITYAANWDVYQDVPFWDALDAVGIQAYFPLTEAGGPTDDAALQAGWARVMAEVSTYSAEVGKPVVFTEVGYARAPQAATRPWESYGRGEGDSRDLQTRCLTLALRAIENEPAVVGSYLWKWFPDINPQESEFQLRNEACIAAIRGVWGQ